MYFFQNIILHIISHSLLFIVRYLLSIIYCLLAIIHYSAYFLCDFERHFYFFDTIKHIYCWEDFCPCGQEPHRDLCWCLQADGHSPRKHRRCSGHRHVPGFGLCLGDFPDFRPCHTDRPQARHEELEAHKHQHVDEPWFGWLGDSIFRCLDHQRERHELGERVYGAYRPCEAYV